MNFYPDIDIKEKEVLANDFFCDFITYLKYVSENRIKMTKTGNVSRFDINKLAKLFKNRDLITEFKKFGWKLLSENQFDYLHRIRVLSEVMYLTYKRKSKILLSKNGGGYLTNIDPTAQYWNMVGHFWNRVNWDYFEPGRDVRNLPLFTFLQQNQNVIWDLLLKNGSNWIDFDNFLDTLKVYFRLNKYYPDSREGKFDFMLSIEYGLIKRNLELFGCVEVIKEEEKYRLGKIVKFRPTFLGLFMFRKQVTGGTYL